MPGVNELPVRPEMHDPMIMNDGSKVATPNNGTSGTASFLTVKRKTK